MNLKAYDSRLLGTFICIMAILGKKNPLNSCALRRDLMIYILIVVKITDTFSIQVGIFGSPSKIELLLLLILAVAKVEILA